MSMTPHAREFVLTSHITFSVAWIGAVGAFLVLAIAGLISNDAETVRASYRAMDLTTWLVIVPSRSRWVDGESRDGTPRWVKLFGVVSIAVVLVFVISQVTADGFDVHSTPIESRRGT